jgi:hypothetical protein
LGEDLSCAFVLMGLHQKFCLMKCYSKDVGARYRPIGNLYGKTKKGGKTFDLRFINEWGKKWIFHTERTS